MEKFKVTILLKHSNELTLPRNDCTDPDAACDGSSCKALISWAFNSPYC